jgi:hypothetical protein
MHELMQTAIRERIYGGLIASAGFLALLGGLAIIDRRVRRELSLLFSGSGPPQGLTTAGERVNDLLLIVLQAARDQTIEHAPLVIFGLAAAVLVLFMMRT